MSEIRPKVQLSPDTGGAGGGGVEKETFQPSFFLKSEQELEGIKHLGFKKQVERLHVAANLSALSNNRNLWEEELLGIYRRVNEPAAEGEEPYDIEEARPFLSRINAHIEQLDTGPQAQSGQERPTPPDQSVRSFGDIAREIRHLVDNPDPARESAVKKEMEVLGKYAKEIGIFDDVKRKVNEHQRKNEFLTAAEKIKSMDLTDDKNLARGVEGWDPRLEGMIETYRWASFYNMMKTWKDIGKGRPDLLNEDAWNKIDEYVNLLNYEDPPYLELRNLASASLAMETRGSGRSSERQVLQELPTYFGAVFEGGIREFQAEHTSIQLLDVTNPLDRGVFILENLDAFNRYFDNPRAWQAAHGEWMKDFKTAADVNSLSAVERGEFKEMINAMMGVTAQARAMEGSLGVPDIYLAILSGQPEKGSQDIQDSIKSLLVHADPEKLNKVIQNPLVKRYYDILMNDAGLVNNPDHEWQVDLQDPDFPTKPDKKITIGSNVELIGRNERQKKRTKERVVNGRLVDYLKDYAKEGGVATYIEEVLLAGDDPDSSGAAGITDDSRRAAAQLACDVFLVDKWTRWQRMIDEEDKLDIQPIGDWGGDPLRSLVNPELVPEKFKKVYVASPVMVLLKSAFKPDDILGGDPQKFGIQPDSELARKLYEQRIVPSGATNLKTIMRYNAALNKILGGSRAGGIARWDRDGISDLNEAVELLDQVYGGRSIKVLGGRKVNIPIGKEIVGAQIARIIEMKAFALAEESADPSFQAHMANAMGEENDRAIFDAARKILWGAELDTKTGLLESIASSRTGLFLNNRNNRFKPQESLGKAWNILAEMNAINQGKNRSAKRVGARVLAGAMDVLKNAPEFK